MAKIELPTAIVIATTIVCLTVALTVAPADVRTQLLAALGSAGTVLAGILPKLIRAEK